MKGLRGKAVLVSGGGGAIGAAICRRFAEAGSQLIVADRNAEAAARVASEVGGRSLAFDIGDYAAAKQALDSVERIDVLVNNAGWDRFQNFLRKKGKKGPGSICLFSTDRDSTDVP